MTGRAEAVAAVAASSLGDRPGRGRMEDRCRQVVVWIEVPHLVVIDKPRLPLGQDFVPHAADPGLGPRVGHAHVVVARVHQDTQA